MNENCEDTVGPCEVVNCNRKKYICMGTKGDLNTEIRSLSVKYSLHSWLKEWGILIDTDQYLLFADNLLLYETPGKHRKPVLTPLSNRRESMTSMFPVGNDMEECLYCRSQKAKTALPPEVWSTPPPVAGLFLLSVSGTPGCPYLTRVTLARGGCISKDACHLCP